MTERQVTAVAGLGVAIVLVVAARHIASSQGAVLGLTPAMSQAVVGLGASAVLMTLAQARS